MSKIISFDPEKYSKSRYSTVIGVAKRAREIAEQAAEEKEILTEKPVKTAMTELIEGRFKIVTVNREKNETSDDDYTEISFH
ncbi:MAG TPA: DNA-directed RNA polymerase subunit omega [Oscillospiraceae bacterium]|nr:DNA-directed RNA polymerase subunit omega [Oscillospiraceae bacterium]HPK35330.1 DNA-directed RNA polymerase subunit omega [Oscillospiraceae bacterium]HPR74654.1 DNA-directed RNA polymerase subunit omega [Oscillospiraceae bacterium]